MRCSNCCYLYFVVLALWCWCFAPLAATMTTVWTGTTGARGSVLVHSSGIYSSCCQRDVILTVTILIRGYFDWVCADFSTARNLPHSRTGKGRRCVHWKLEFGELFLFHKLHPVKGGGGGGQQRFYCRPALGKGQTKHTC